LPKAGCWRWPKDELRHHVVGWWGEGGEGDAIHGFFVFVDGGGAAEDGGEDDDGGGGEEGFAFFTVGVFDDAALEESSRCGHDGVALFGFFLIAHAEVTARALEIHHVFVFGAGDVLRGVVVEFEAGVFLEDVPVAFFFEFVNNVVCGGGDDEGGLKFDFALLLFKVFEHLGEDLEVAFVDHAGADEAEVDFFTAFVVGEFTDDVVSVSLGDVVVVDVWVGDHWFVDDVEVDDHFGVILGVGIGGEWWGFARLDFGDARVGEIDEALEDLFFVIHAFADHDLDAAFGDLEGFDEGVGLGDTDGGFCLHFGGPVGEGEGLVGEE